MPIEVIQKAATEQMITLIADVSRLDDDARWQLRLGLENILLHTERALRPQWLKPHDELSMTNAKQIVKKAWNEAMETVFLDDAERQNMLQKMAVWFARSHEIKPFEVGSYLNAIIASERSRRIAA